MKILISMIVLMVSTQAFSADLKFKTLAEARSTGQYNIHCESRDSGYKVYATFSQQYTPTSSTTGSLVLVEPGEGLFVRHWPHDSTTIPWYVMGTATEVKITGRFLMPYSETVAFTIQESTSANGRFRGTIEYFSSAGVNIKRSVNCRANNYSPVP